MKRAFRLTAFAAAWFALALPAAAQESADRIWSGGSIVTATSPRIRARHASRDATSMRLRTLKTPRGVSKTHFFPRVESLRTIPEPAEQTASVVLGLGRADFHFYIAGDVTPPPGDTPTVTPVPPTLTVPPVETSVEMTDDTIADPRAGT